MQKTISLREQLRQHETLGIFPSSEGQLEFFGFWDWFCKDSSLQRRSKSLVSKLKRFLKANPAIDLDKNYAFFKNNCPMNGPTYDDFRICDRKTGEVQYTVVPRCSHSGKAEVWGRNETGFGCLKKADSFKEVLVF